MTLDRFVNLNLLLYRNKHLSTIRLLNDLVLDLLGLLLLLNENWLLRDDLLLGQLRLLRELLYRLLLDPRLRLAQAIFLSHRLLHQRVDVSFGLSFGSQGCDVNEASSDCRGGALHFLIHSILKSSDAVKALKVLWDLAGVSCHFDGLAVHELKVVLNDSPAILLAHVAVLPGFKLKHVMRGGQPAILPVGKLMLPLELGAEVNID